MRIPFRKSDPEEEAAKALVKRNASILALLKKQADSMIEAAINAGLISPGQAKALGAKVASATLATISGVIVDVASEIGAPRPAPEPEEEFRQEPETGTDIADSWQ